MKVHSWVTVELDSLLTSALDSDWPALRTGHCTPGERSLVAIKQHVGWTSEKITQNKNLITADSRTKIYQFSSIIPVPPSAELSLVPCRIIFIHKVSEVFMTQQPYWNLGLPLSRFRNHRHNTTGMTPLDVWSAHRRALYLITHNTHERHTYMPLVGFEPAIQVSQRPTPYTVWRPESEIAVIIWYLTQN
jgi:hypothetical protein